MSLQIPFAAGEESINDGMNPPTERCIESEPEISQALITDEVQLS